MTAAVRKTAEKDHHVDDSISFERRRLPFRLLVLMFRERILTGTTCHLLRVVTEHGGYIAGGFGTLLARWLILGEGKHVYNLKSLVRGHLKQPIDPRKMPESIPAWRINANVGDIDVWFPDEASMQGFMSDPRRLRLLAQDCVWAAETVTGTAVEHVVPGDARIQVITRFLMPLEEQLSRFDIYNGMVAFTEDEVVFPEHWEVLERGHVLHVSTWKTPWTVNRFFKWLRRKGYQHVTPVTADHLVEAAVETLDWFKAHEGELTKEDMQAAISKNVLLKQVALQPANVQDFILPIMSALSAERLLEVSALFRPAPQHYDRAMQEIRKRMPL